LEVVGGGSSAFLAAELTRANGLRRGKSSSQRNDWGPMAVRWSNVRPDRVGQAASNTVGETAESGKSRSMENQVEDGAADSEQHGFSVSGRSSSGG